MSRSVDYLSGAQHIAYKHLDQLFDREIDETDWDFLEEDLTDQLQQKFPSLEVCDRWDDRETKIFLENEFCEVGISEYNGLVSISMRAKDEYDSWYGGPDKRGLAAHWVDQAKNKFMALSDLVKVGTFSNGEAVFKTKSKPPVTYTSKEGRADWM